MAVTEKTGTFVGTSVKRKEDATLLTGRATYVDNMTLPGTVTMAVVRSPYAHARIKRVNLDAARAAEGGVAAFSGAELAADWKGSLRCAPAVPAGGRRGPLPGRGRRRRDRREPRAGEGCGRARRGRLRAARRRRRRRE